MKKIISVFLAILMVFSVVTVAFAADEQEVSNGTPSEQASEGSTEGGFDIKDMPLWQVKLLLKGGKIGGKAIIKIATILFKLALSFGLVDLSDILKGVIDFVTNMQGGNDGNEEPSTTVPQAEPSTAELVVAA